MKASNNKIPKVAEFLLKKMVSDYNEFALLGDFEEIFHEYCETRGRFYAVTWYWFQILVSLPKFLIHKIYWGVTMFGNYLKIAVRHLFRQKGYSFINTLGLSVSIAICIIIYLYISHEISYDNYHQDLDRIFRVTLETRSETTHEFSAKTSAPTGMFIKDNYPQVEAMGYLLPLDDGVVTHGDKIFSEGGRAMANNEIFNVLTIPFIRGNKENALTRPLTAVICETIASKYFGTENPVGKLLKINSSEYEVTGVVKDAPQNSHLQYQIILSLATIAERYPFQAWFLANFYTYIKLKPGVDVETFRSQIKSLITENCKEDLIASGEEVDVLLQPINDIHLTTYYINEPGRVGNPYVIKILGAIGILILLIACINFINLTTARSVSRAKEVAMRKVIGGYRYQLIYQFLGENFFVTMISLFISFIMIAWMLPILSTVSGIDFGLTDVINTNVLLLMLAIVSIVTIISGGYPAFIISKYKPALVLKGNVVQGKGKSLLRKTLVVFQFSASVILLISTLLVYEQVNFMKNNELGFNKENKLIIPLLGPAGRPHDIDMVKQEFKKSPDIIDVSYSAYAPGEARLNRWTTTRSTETGDISHDMYYYYFDENYIDMYNLKIIAGRNFSKEISTDHTDAYIINRRAADILGFSSPADAVGKSIQGSYGGTTRQIIGVVEDFHFLGLQNLIEPMVMEFEPRMYGRINISLNKSATDGTIQFIKSKWNERFAGAPFEYYFLDEQFNRQYIEEEKFGQLLTGFATLGFMIACLGLFALAAFTAESKTKEIGIRKVLGASVSGIIIMLSKDFTKLVLISNIFAWPIAYYVMTKWLEDFAYRTSIHLALFLLAGLSTLLIAVVTISYQSFRAASADPVKSLKYE